MRSGRSGHSIPFLFFIAAVLSIAVFSEAQEGKGPAGDASGLYAGMSKEDLMKVYPGTNEIDYYRRGREEWLIYDDIKTPAKGDRIIFYIKDNKLVWWNNEVMPQTPEERLKVIEDRQKYCGSMPWDPFKNQNDAMQNKENSRRSKIENSKDVPAVGLLP